MTLGDLLLRNCSVEKLNALNGWKQEQEKKVVEMQRKSLDDRVAAGVVLSEHDKMMKDMLDEGVAYYGAIDGSLSYIFTPMSLGLGVRVRHNVTLEEFDATDYDNF